MVLEFKDIKSFLQLRDRSIGVEPHFSDDARFDRVGVRLRGRDALTMVDLRSTVEDTVDSIFAEVSELRGRSA